MASIYLIRHGQASFGKDDYDCLSRLGEQQAAHLGVDLSRRGIQFDKVISGGMLRHQQTANSCLRSMQANQSVVSQMTVNADWNEYDHQDILAQLNPDFANANGIKNHLKQQQKPNFALQVLLDSAFSRWISNDYVDDYNESWCAYQTRIRQALQTTVEQAGDAKNIAVFSSGGPIALLSQLLLNVPAKNLMDVNWTLVNCGISKIIISSKGQILSTLNEHTAFEGHHRHLITYK
ncbi:histidine phosphatase family protein [Paraglaciecola sp. L1A13]|uniref:histidine phosphatase family protein n=1 Tax=Paraglaciecola sp. L1A13 TaxID=2686359 RepID=UPI00131E585F|nr:histidine phosphatase family protein [Paraglaciecola sp. L1A13]|tara:strand:- start:622 stop:1326 length:705 start_codon:yes stop_codon:yes gene_type:complete